MKTVLVPGICLLLCWFGANAAAQQANEMPAGSNNNSAQAQSNEELVRRASNNIRDAVSVLVPGGIVEGTPRSEKFDAVIAKFGRGQVRDALNDLTQMAAEDSTLPPAEVLLAGLSFAVGDNASGVTLLENCAVKYPNYPGVYLSFAQLALNTSRVTDASLHADKAASLIEAGELSDEQQKHFLKQYYEIAAGIYSRRQQDQKALEMLDRLQQVAPDRPFYFVSKAELSFRAGDAVAALEFLKRHAQSINSKNLPELTLVEWLNKARKTDAARQLLTDTVAKNPEDARAQLMIAQMYMAEEKFVEAEQAVKAFETLNGNEIVRTIDIKGRIAFAGGNYDIAQAYFKVLNQRLPNDPSTANIYALSLVEDKDPDKRLMAQRISSRVIKRVPKNILAQASYGYISLKVGELEQATETMQSVALSGQTTPEISYLVASWLVETGQKDQAKKILDQAVNSKGMFLYRSASRRLLAEIQ